MVSGVFSIPLDGTTSSEAVRKGRRPALALRQFIAGSENALVQVAVKSLLEPQSGYNPLVFFGPTGTGKTLLASGLAAKWKSEHNGSKVLVITGADFARTYANAVDTDSLADLRARYRRAALLVLEDLHELAAKLPAQQELIRMLDELLTRQRRVLVTSRQAPTEMRDLAAGLASRLAAGLTVPLAAPGSDARRAILQRLAEVHDVPLPAEAVGLLVDGLPGVGSPWHTAPQLNQAILQLKASTELQEQPLDRALVERILAEQTAQKQPTLRSITSQVCQYFRLKVGDVVGPTRRQQVVRGRGIAMYLARRLTGHSLQQVGRHFGRRDHTTVLHACRKTEHLLQTDPDTRQVVEELIRQITAP